MLHLFIAVVLICLAFRLGKHLGYKHREAEDKYWETH
jgi:hypothetical protein